MRRPLRSALCIVAALSRVACEQSLNVGERASATTPDAARDAALGGAAAIPCGNAVVCDGFDSELPSGAEAAPAGMTELNADVVYHGPSAFAGTAEGSTSFARARYALPGYTSGSVFIRAFFLVPEGVLEGRINVLSLIPGVGNGVDINLSAGGGMDIFLHEDAAGRFVAPDDNLWPEGTWFCLRARVDISQSAGQVSVWIDDTLAFSTPGEEPTLSPGGFVGLQAGVVWTEMNPSDVLVYMDELALDTSELACE